MDDGKRSLLIIDDDETYREVLSRSLERKGFAVITAGTPEEALERCGLHVPECVLLDLNLSGQSGLNLIRPLLTLSPQTRIVILTGYASIQTAVGALKLGAAHYLPKPASVADIVKVLISDEIEIPETPGESRMSVRHLEWEYIQRVLAEHEGNIAATARALGMHRRTLQRKLSKKRAPEPA